MTYTTVIAGNWTTFSMVQTNRHFILLP